MPDCIVHVSNNPVARTIVCSRYVHVSAAQSDGHRLLTILWKMDRCKKYSERIPVIPKTRRFFKTMLPVCAGIEKRPPESQKKRPKCNWLRGKRRQTTA